MIARLLCLAAILAGGCTSHAPKYSFTLPDLHTKLPNGMRVILLPDSTTQLVEVDVRYEVGSREDPEGKAGLAHLVEHLMFQQRQAGPDKPPIKVVLDTLTLYVNAFTNWDSTHYMALGDARHAEKLIALEAARLHTGCDTIDEATFQREREVVRNEIRTRTGSPEAEVSRRVLQAAYPEGHPYRRYIGGDDKELVNITLADVCKFMEDYYVPERAVVLIAGNVERKLAEQYVATYLAPLTKRAARARRVVAPVVPHHDTLEIELPVEEPMVVGIWPLPPAHSNEGQLAMYGVGTLIGMTSALGLVYEFATDFGIEILGGSEAPLLAVYVSVTDEGKIDEAKSALRKAAGRAQRSVYLTKEGTAEFHARVVGDRVTSMEALPTRTFHFAEWAQFAPDHGYFGGELARIKGIKDTDITRALKKYMDEDRVTFIVVKPSKGAKASYERGNLEFAANGNAIDSRDKLPIDRAEAARALEIPPHRTRAKRAKSFVMSNGMKVILLPMDTLIPTVTIAVEFGAGKAHEPVGRAGLARIAAQHIQWAGKDDAMYHDVMGRVGIDWGGDLDEDSTRFYARGLELYLHEAIFGLERILATGDYSQRSIEHAQRLARSSMRRKSASARERFRIAFASALFPNHPYGHVETVDSLGRLGRDSALAWRQDHFTAKNATVVVVGRFDTAKAEESLRGTFGLWSGGKSDANPTATTLERSGATFLAVEGRELPTIELKIGYPLPPGLGDRHAARLVVAEMVNERVATVREKLGASYGVYARARTRLGPGELVIGGPLDAKRAGESVAAIRDGLRQLKQGEHLVEDFVRARRAVLRQLVADDASPAQLAFRVLEYERHGLSPTYNEELIQTVAALGPRDVMAALGELRDDAEVVALLGAKDAVTQAYRDAGITTVTWK